MKITLFFTAGAIYVKTHVENISEMDGIGRQMPFTDEVKIRAGKWQQAVETIDWLTTQIPRDSRFQVYTFNTRAGAVVPGTDRQ